MHMTRVPGSQDGLEVVAFDTSPGVGGAVDVRDGILFSRRGGKAYPIMNGVPVMFEGAFTREFLDRHRHSIARESRLSGLSFDLRPGTSWSFSREWQAHFDTDSDRTWGYTVQERFEQLLMETQVDADWLNGRVVLDAGCGNGALSAEIARYGAVVVGLDYATSVFDAESRRRTDRVHFLQGDLQAPALAEGSFDLVFAIGVLHHTRKTATTFRQVAPLVKPGGKFYVWLYRRPEGVLGRYVKVPAYDMARFVISRLPPLLQDGVVGGYARLVKALHAIRNRAEVIPLREYLVSAYDDLTPRWRHYHTPIEVSRWFHECGFSPPTMTHWDNRFGFGMVATRTPQARTPGLHYGTNPRLWDEAHTVLGRLHSKD